jgi:tetratricopeptide (TPR) repeat protein
LLLLALAVAVAGLAGAGAWLWHDLRVRGEWRQAEAALQRLDLAAAAAHLDRYLERRPGDAAAWFLAARTARRLGRYPEAERCLTRCQQLGGVTAATRLEWDLLRVQQGDLGGTDTRLRLTVAPDHPDAPLVLEALARGYLVCGRLNDVVEACDLWASRQPDHPWPWLWRGDVFGRLGNYHQALADYRRALESAPEDRDVRLALGGLLARRREPGAAAEQFEYLLGRSPDDGEALLGLAACRIEQGRPEDAVPLVERVLSGGAPPARALFLRGKAALEQRDAAGAVGWLNRAVEAAPDEPESLHLLTLALRADGRHDEADRLVPRLEALRRDVARLNELVRAAARDPDDARTRHEAGVLALRIGRADEGVRWLRAALRARGDHRATHAALAEHYRRLGDPRADLHRRLAETP